MPSMRVGRSRAWTASANHVIDFPTSIGDRQWIDRAAAIAHASDPVAGAAFVERVVAHGIIPLAAQAPVLSGRQHRSMPRQRREAASKSQAAASTRPEMRDCACVATFEVDQTRMIGCDGIEPQLSEWDRSHEAIARMAPKSGATFVGAERGRALQGQVDRAHAVLAQQLGRSPFGRAVLHAFFDDEACRGAGQFGAQGRPEHIAANRQAVTRDHSRRQGHRLSGRRRRHRQAG